LEANHLTHAGRHILIYADGSCSGPPGPGGYAAVLRRMDGSTELRRKAVLGFEPEPTTNVRMEMTAVAAALEAIKAGEPEPIIIYSNSNLLANGMLEWAPVWVANDWRKKDKSAVVNSDLWQRLIAASEGKCIDWRWVKGHAGNVQKGEVNRLARTQMQKALALSFGFAA